MSNKFNETMCVARWYNTRAVCLSVCMCFEEKVCWGYLHQGTTTLSGVGPVRAFPTTIVRVVLCKSDAASSTQIEVVYIAHNTPPTSFTS